MTGVMLGSFAPGRRAALLLSCTALACTAWFVVNQGARPAYFETADGEAKVHIPGGVCSLGDFMPAMSCQQNNEADACCNGLKRAFAAQCPCRPLPGIVISHGGSGLGLMDNMVRCGYTEGLDPNGEKLAPIEFATQKLGCVDRKEWCSNLLPNVDIRLSQANKGALQIADAKLGWVYASASGDPGKVAKTVCAALGYRKVVRTAVDNTINAFKAINCDHGGGVKVSECSVKDLAPIVLGALTIECDREASLSNSVFRPEICMRVGQSHNRANNLVCTSSVLGTGVAGHTRKIGAPNSVCGTAGINETRIEWFDGFQDDFSAYALVQRLTDGVYLSFKKFRGEVAGHDLLTSGELMIDKRKAHMNRFEHAAAVNLKDQTKANLAQAGEIFNWDSRLRRRS
ncbi:hypothetical protein T492DRAFT_1036884 [Pavlovales sp. CCMP2436]|nr:hypothetical protein T492DRAFT_1036884 [Pavlovales sp. CCMP2436]